MIEKYVINYLNEKGIKTYGQIPDKHPAEYCVAQLMASGQKNCIDSATIDLHCYAQSVDKSEIFAGKIRDVLLDDMRSESCISSVRLGDFSLSNDKSLKTPRYDVTVNIWFYKEEIEK